MKYYSYPSLQGDQIVAVPLIFKVDPDGFYLYARGDKSKVCINIVFVYVRFDRKCVGIKHH